MDLALFMNSRSRSRHRKGNSFDNYVFSLGHNFSNAQLSNDFNRKNNRNLLVVLLVMSQSSAQYNCYAIKPELITTKQQELFNNR